MRSWYKIVNEGVGAAVIYIYGTVGMDWWGDGVSALQFARELDALGSRDVELRVNSEGGDVFEGYAIYSAINRYPGKVTAFVDGLAASAASFLILAADEVVMGAASCLFIHQAWTIAMGNAGQLRDIADRLDILDEQIVGIYAAHSNKEADEIRATLEATKLFSAEEAVEWGFASRIDEGLKAAASISRSSAHLLFKDALPDGLVVRDEEIEVPTCEPPSDTDSTIDPAADTVSEEDDGSIPSSEDAPAMGAADLLVALAKTHTAL